jgi:hypothetical protein
MVRNRVREKGERKKGDERDDIVGKIKEERDRKG